MKQRILFICLGNICRSCTAEEIFRSLAIAQGYGENYEIDSAGLIDYHEGELPDGRMRRIAARHGYQLTHRSRPVTTADFDYFDWVVAMDDNNRIRLCELASTDAQRAKIISMADYLTQHPTYSFIPDPYYGGDADFELVVELLEDACAEFLHKTCSAEN